MAYLPVITWASEVPNLTITENTNPKIAELYQQLQDVQNKVSQIQSERVDKLSENYQAVKENEQSLENRTLTAATTAATGLGGMELARGLAEQSADKDADQDMTAYIETFRCEYGNGKSVKGGTTEIELPGGNNSEMMRLRTEYFALAADLKERKEALGMKPGIESEAILDKAELGLYDDESVGITGGAYASLYRAKMGNETDQSKIDEEKQKSSNRVKGGAIAAGAGVVGGIVGNAIINKDAPKNESDKINAEYDKQVAEATKEQEDLTNQLNQAIAENAAEVQNYNNQIQQHQDQIAAINQAPADCQELFADYISMVSNLSPIENETDSVPDMDLPDISEQKTLLAQCTQCDSKGAVFDSETKQCSCPPERPIEKDGKCVEKPVETTPAPVIETEPIVESDPVIEQEPVVEVKTEEEKPETEEISEDETTENEDSEGEYCPATGNRLKSINDKTKIGDECSSTNIAAGEVIWAKTKQPKTICTCVAYVCNNGYHSVSGRCDKDEVKIPNCPRQEYSNVPNIKTGNDALKFCETKGGKQCKTVNAIKDYTGIKGKVLCNAGSDEFGAAKQRAADAKLQYYNCGETDKLPKGITCKFIQDFKREKVTPMEAEGLMKEYALKKYKDDIKCDKNSHRKSNDYRQCASRKNSKYFYEFEFKDLDAGNGGFTDALCLIWGLKGGMNLCKNASQSQCQEISTAINRTFYIGGDAKLNGTNCIINSHPRAESAPVAVLNTHVMTKEDMRTVGTIDPLHFYDKKLQVNANADVYKTITNYLFVEQRLPVKQFSCGAGFVDNTMYYNVSRQKYNETQEKIRKCQQDSQNYSGGGEHAAQGMGGAMLSCNRQYPLDSKSGDLLTCEYDGKPIDFLFKKLDVKWNRKSTAGYQGLLCLGEGGSFTGKSCTLANRQQCDAFNARFKKDYPNSKGMEWDDDLGTCVLKDAKYVSNVQKVAEVSGMVALTLVTAVSGGPVVWALSVVEGAALVTEAVTEEKISNWAENFLVDAARCNNNSTCANGVMKKHIARIMEGSKQFDETQNKQIAKQTERLLGMLDEKTVSAIVDKGESSGYIGEDRDPDLEKSIRAYYGTQLTSDEKRLLTTKKVATVATFATLIGGGIMAGLRQSFKHNLIHISKAKQARWLDLKILKVSDVTDDVVAMSKTGQKAAAKAGALAPVATDASADVAKGASREMTPAQAKKLEELDTKIAKLEAKTNRTADEAAELKKLRQERNTLLNKVGTKDADEIAKLSSAAFDQKAIETAQTEYETAKKRYDYVKKYMSEHNGNLPQGTTKYDLQTINNNMANAEKKLKDLGQEVVPVEPLQIGKKPTVTPAETKPVDNTTKPKDTKPAEPKPAESGAKPKETSGEPKPAESETPKGTAESTPKKPAEETPKTDPKQSSKPADDAGRAPVGNPVKSKSQKIAEARQRGDLGYHGTDADISMDDMIRSSANSSDRLGSVGYGVARDYDAAEKYAVKRLVERQNIGKSIDFYREGDVLVIESSETLNLSNKTGYVYTTAKESSVKWETLRNGYVGAFDAAQMPHSVEVLDKKAFNLDDLVRQGKVKIIEPKATKAANASSGVKAAPKGAASTASKSASKADDVVAISATQAKASNVATLRQSASKSFDKYLAEVKTSPTGKGAKLPKSRLNDAGWNEVNKSLAGDNVQLVDTGDGYMQFVRANHVDDEVEVVGVVSKPSASTASKSAGKAENVATSAVKAQAPSITDLRQTASKNFDTYLAEAKTSTSGKSAHKIPKSRLNDAEWDAINKSLASENVQLVDTGDGYMQFVRANHVDDGASAVRGAGNVARNAIPSDFSPAAKNFINDINEIGATKEYAVSRGVGAHANQSQLSRQETDYIRQLLNDRDDLIARNVSQPDGSGGNLGANWFVTKKTNDMFVDGTNTVLRRINTRPINNLRGKSITTINGKSVFLEPLDNGGLIGNVSGRPVVVVNYNGHRIPFYASSGSAGKLDVPTGKWEVFFGFGKGTRNPGWFNKGGIDQIVGHYGSPELKKIAEALDNAIGDQRNIEDVFATISRKMYNGKGIVASYDGPVASKDFINSLLDFTPADYGAGNGQLLRNIEYVKSYFK